jgi:hypothetical protein
MPPATDSIALEPAELARILEPEVGILILRRSPTPAISDEIADLPANALRGARARLDAGDIGGTIARLLVEHDLDPQHLRQGQPNRLAPFQVAVLKGERFPGNAGRGLVHRSPPIAGTNTVRVLLCIDA